MTTLKNCFAKKHATTQCSSSSPPPTIVIDTEEPRVVPISAGPADSRQTNCSLDCCDLTKPTPAHLHIDKEATSRSYGKRKRYFQNEWLQTYEWLVLCKTNTKTYCQTCFKNTLKLVSLNSLNSKVDMTQKLI